MDDLSVQLKALTRYTLIILVICGISWLLLPQFQGYVIGFALGVGVGMMNAHYLSFKIKQLTMQAEAQSDDRQPYGRTMLGFFTRASIAALAIIFAIKNDSIEVPTIILGLLIMPIVTLIIGFNAARKK